MRVISRYNGCGMDSALTLVLVGVLAFLAARIAATLFVRRLAARGDERARSRLRWWAESPLSPVRAEARLMLADRLRAVNAAEALEVLGPMLELEGRKAVPGLLLAAKWALTDKWYERAERHAGEAAARLGRSKDKLVRSRIHRFRAEIAVRAGKLEQAAELLGAAVADNTFDAETRLARASLAFQRGGLETALADYAFLEANFGNPALRVQAALGASYALVSRAQYGEALAHLNAVIEGSDQQHAVLVYRRAAVRALRGDAEGARGDLAGLDEHTDLGAYVLGCIAAAERDWDAARRRLAEVIVRGPLQDVRTAEAIWVLSGVLALAGQPDQSRDMTARLRTLWPESSYLNEVWQPLKVH
jgi:hypothetical protein